MELINLFILSLIIMNITDVSGFIPNIEHCIAKWLGVKEIHIKLLECSYCQNWWCGLIYIIITNNFNLFNLLYILLLSFLLPTFLDIQYGLREKLNSLIRKFL